MEYHILESFRKARSAINGVFFLLVIFQLSAQNFKPELVHYDLIKKVISEDTIIHDWQRRILKSKVIKGVLEPVDTVNYINTIKQAKLILDAKALNKNFLEKIKEIQDKDIIKWIGIKINNTHLSKIPKEFEFKNNTDLKGIKVEKEPNKQLPYHKFSTPLKLERNIYLVYWLKYNGTLNSSSQFIKYKINSIGEVIILGYYPISKS